MATPTKIIGTSYGYIPSYIQGDVSCTNLKGEVAWRCTIRPILQSDQTGVATFLSSAPTPYSRNGLPMPMEAAIEKTKEWIQGHLGLEPWFAYLLHNEKGLLAGIWSMEHDPIQGDLHFSIHLGKKDQKKGIGTGVWRWVCKQFLPAMAEKGFLVAGKALEEAKIHVTVHPSHFLTAKLEKIGFTKQKIGNLDPNDHFIRSRPGDEYVYFDTRNLSSHHDGQCVQYEISVLQAMDSPITHFKDTDFIFT